MKNKNMKWEQEQDWEQKIKKEKIEYHKLEHKTEHGTLKNNTT